MFDFIYDSVFGLLKIIFIFMVIFWGILEVRYHQYVKRSLFIDLMNPDRSKNLIVLFNRAKEEKEAGERGRLKFKEDQQKCRSGIFLGKDPATGRRIFDPESNEGHLLITGSPGTGKTAGLVLTTLLSWRSTFFAIDTGGDITKTIHRPGLYVYAPCEGKGFYNPFYLVDLKKDINDKLLELSNIAFALMPDIATTKENGASYFEEKGRNLLNAALIFYYLHKVSFAGACKAICILNEKALYETLTSDERTNPYILPLISDMNGSRYFNDIKSSCQKAVSVFANDIKIARTLEHPKNASVLNPGMLEKRSAILRVSLQDLKGRAQPLIRLIVAQLLSYFTNRPIGSKRILLMLDEFGNMGNIYQFEPYLANVRKNGIRVMILTQSLPQIMKYYGENEAEAIINDCKIIGCLTNVDTKTREYLSKLTASTYEQRFGTSNNDMMGSGVSMSYRDKQVVEAWEFSNMGDKQFILQTLGDRYRSAGYIFLQKENWFNSEYFKDLKKKREAVMPKQPRVRAPS